MSETLDLKVAAALMRLRLIERALHDRGEWSMEYAGARVPVSRFHREHCISFVAHFDAMCPIGDAPRSLDLYSGEDLVRVIPLEDSLPEDGCTVWWDLSLHTPVSV